MTPGELARMKNPMNHKNLDRIRKLICKVQFCIDTRSRNAIETHDWFREIADELCGCKAILIEEYRRRTGHDGGEKAEAKRTGIVFRKRRKGARK